MDRICLKARRKSYTVAPLEKERECSELMQWNREEYMTYNTEGELLQTEDTESLK